jgi:hypothetical protein
MIILQGAIALSPIIVRQKIKINLQMKPLTVILLLSITLTSCQNKLSALKNDTLTIRGNIKGFEGETVYLKKINAISYNDESVIDSCKVEANGNFEFKTSEPLPFLANISKNGRQHPIHEILQYDPDKYYYGYCAMFFVPEPTLYITKNATIEFDWTVAGNLDNYTFDAVTSTNQKDFYSYYLNVDISESLYQADGDFKKMDPVTAWKGIEKAIENTRKAYGLNDGNLNDDFNNYLNTEIYLGAANMYANWYEYIFNDELLEAFTSGEPPSQYVNIFSIFERSEWNMQSVEYYKMTERFVTFNLNKLNKNFKKFYPTSKEKISIAKKVLKPTIAEKYISNISNEAQND